ncbi:hypothetical protein [Ponticaulis profundi]|uniref:Uncharacterized protein n=1 Tax=Ponticaulis profundi TaxID=2665222 RepID=A0ABW1SBT4_9PROT
MNLFGEGGTTSAIRGFVQQRRGKRTEMRKCSVILRVQTIRTNGTNYLTSCHDLTIYQQHRTGRAADAKQKRDKKRMEAEVIDRAADASELEQQGARAGGVDDASLRRQIESDKAIQNLAEKIDNLEKNLTSAQDLAAQRTQELEQLTRFLEEKNALKADCSELQEADRLLDEREQELLKMRRNLNAAQIQLREIKSSTSWRITAPIRRIKTALLSLK